MSEGDRDRNIVAAICYIPVFSIVISIIILFVEKEDRFIRFHAMQSFLFSAFYFSAVFIFGGIPFLSGMILGLFFVMALVIWIYGILSAYRGQIFKLLFIGKISEKYIK